MTTFPITLQSLREILFDGIEKDYIPMPQQVDIRQAIELDHAEVFFHKEGDILWSSFWWRKSLERQNEARERNKKDTAKYHLKKEACTIFARALYKIAHTDRETGVHIAERLLVKKDWAKFEGISGLNLNDEKWKGLKE
jgi:hypothetical protein